MKELPNRTTFLRALAGLAAAFGIKLLPRRPRADAEAGPAVILQRLRAENDELRSQEVKHRAIVEHLLDHGRRLRQLCEDHGIGLMDTPFDDERDS